MVGMRFRRSWIFPVMTSSVRGSNNQHSAIEQNVQDVLVWPLSICAGTKEGFVVGWSWSSQELTSGISTRTIAAAGVVDTASALSQLDLCTEYDSIQMKIDSFLKKTREHCCPCLTHESSKLDELQIVGYVSQRLDRKTQQWLQSRQLSYISSRGKYPCLMNLASEALHQQVLLYEPQNVYRHSLSSLDSRFSKILFQCSLSCSIMENLTKSESEIVSQQKRGRETVSVSCPAKTPHNQGSIVEILQKYSLTIHHCVSTDIDGHPRFTLLRILSSYQNLLQTSDCACQLCQKPILTRVRGPTPHEKAINFFIKTIIDSVAGLLLGVLILGCWHYRGHTVLVKASSYFVDQTMLQECLQWLESYPIGFKLNIPLTQNIGKEVWSLAQLHQRSIDAITSEVASVLTAMPWFRPWAVLSFLVFTSVLGGSILLAFTMDIIRLLTWHLALLHRSFGHVYRGEMYLLATLWKLFRGKKRNVLRQRTDTMDYDSMQLLTGIILFVVSLFLLTTILVYYFFFTLLNLVVRTGISLLFWMLYTFLQDFPFGTCYLRWQRPEMFVYQVYLMDMVEGREDTFTSGVATSDIDDIQIVSVLIPRIESVASILLANGMLKMRARAFISWLRLSVNDIIYGSATSEPLLLCLVSPVASKWQGP